MRWDEERNIEMLGSMNCIRVGEGGEGGGRRGNRDGSWMGGMEEEEHPGT